MARNTLSRIGTAVGGTLLILVGVAGLVLPILPGFLLIVGGLLVLGTKFDRPRRMAHSMKRRVTGPERDRLFGGQSQDTIDSSN